MRLGAGRKAQGAHRRHAGTCLGGNTLWLAHPTNTGRVLAATYRTWCVHTAAYKIAYTNMQ